MEQEEQNIDSLYDFLYLDKVRIRSWYAQLFDEGVLTHFKSASSSSNESSGGTKVGVPTVASGEIASKRVASNNNEFQYDAEWSLPLTLLDKLDEKGVICKSLVDAKLGSLVLVRGFPQIIDIEFINKFSGQISNLLVSQARSEAKSSKERNQVIELEKNLKISIDLLKSLPSMPQITLSTESGLAWACLKREHMIVSTDYLNLTHGAFINEEWYMLAILDAYPDAQIDNEDRANNFMFSNNDLFNGIMQIVHAMRTMAGRSKDAFAINPVAIFRKIS